MPALTSPMHSLLCMSVIVDSGIIMDSLGKSSSGRGEATANYKLQNIIRSVSPFSLRQVQVRPLCTLWRRTVPDPLQPIFTDSRRGQGRGAKPRHGIKTGSTGSPTGSTGSLTGSTGSPTGSTGSSTSGVGPKEGYQAKKST